MLLESLLPPTEFLFCRDEATGDESGHIASIGQVEFFHYDLVLQALAKLERGHARDLKDVVSLLSRKFITVSDLRVTFEAIEPALLRYPAIDPAQFKKKLEDFLGAR